MGPAAAVMEPPAVEDDDLEELLSSASMEEVEGLVKVPGDDGDGEHMGQTGLDAAEDNDDDILSAAACEQILDKLMVASNGSQLPSMGWEESFNELFPDLA